MRKILAALAITSVFASCKKETVITPAPAASKKLVQITYSSTVNPTEINNITYDLKGRMLTYITANRTYSFSYESDSRLVVTGRKKSDNTLQTTYECTLNNKGAITEILFKDPAGVHTYTYQYTYDGNNYMTKVKGFSPSGSSYEIQAGIVNGDVVSAKNYSDGVQGSTTVYTYAGAKTNKLPTTIGSYWPSLTLFGKIFPHLSTECKVTTIAGTLTWNSTAAYELDADGDVTKTTSNNLHSGTSDISVYQYQ